MIKENISAHENFIKFLGTAGARFVTINQWRASGGIWISFEGTNILIDPGPGSLVSCLNAQPPLDPTTLDGIILTHKHIDHCNDINIMIEAMTWGGSKNKGSVFVPSDVLNENSILIDYARKLPKTVVALNEKENYRVGSIRFRAPLRLIHPVETYGLLFTFGEKTVSLIADTGYFEEICNCFKADVVVMNTVLIDPVEGVNHLSIKEAGEIISKIRPRQAILTHFGRDVLKAGPDELTRQLTAGCGIEVTAATDGMHVNI